MGVISERETQQIEAAKASGRAPVVSIHGLWLLPSSWANWVQPFEEAGYAALTPGWPDDPETVEEARANPDVFAKKTLGQIADHTAEVIGKLDRSRRSWAIRPADWLPKWSPTAVCRQPRWRSLPGHSAACCRFRSRR